MAVSRHADFHFSIKKRVDMKEWDNIPIPPKILIKLLLVKYSQSQKACGNLGKSTAGSRTVNKG